MATTGRKSDHSDPFVTGTKWMIHFPIAGGNNLIWCGDIGTKRQTKGQTNRRLMMILRPLPELVKWG